jgi:hypothetical protein
MINHKQLIFSEICLMVRSTRRIINLIGATGLVILSGAGAAHATATLQLISGSQSTMVQGNMYSNPDFNGWDVIISFGSSNSPGLTPYALDLADVVETCWSGTGCATDPLSIYVSDTGFTQIAPGLGQAYSMIGSGVTTQTAYADPSNALFGTNTPTSELIGTITLSDSGTVMTPDNGDVSVGPDPYSLTLVDTYEPDNGAGVFFSTDGDINLPEPGSLALFASSLTMFGWARRRCRRA